MPRELAEARLELARRDTAEAAAATGRSQRSLNQGSLKVNLHRALKNLRTRLGQVG